MLSKLPHLSSRLSKQIIQKKDHLRTLFAVNHSSSNLITSFPQYSNTIDYRLGYALALCLVSLTSLESDCDAGVKYDSEHVITNWSGSESCKPLKVYQPNSQQEVLRLLQHLHAYRQRARPIGTSLSPNGIGMNANDSLISVSHLDSIEVDPVNKLVTVGAGVRVSEVLKALDKYNLTLENFSSIQEQQLAGWTQVSAHGTGITLPTVDEMIVRLKLATPPQGLLTLSQHFNPQLFSYAKVGLGSLGVVTELTLKCTPKHDLKEHSFVLTQQEIKQEHKKRLTNYRHVRYMWLPYTNQVVSIVSNPTSIPSEQDFAQQIVDKYQQKVATKELLVDDKPIRAMINLLKEQKVNHTLPVNLEELSFADLRDLLLSVAPLNPEYVKKVNQAEAKYWQQVTGTRIDDSKHILGFNCGGAQYVYEVCIPMKIKQNPEFTRDLEFMNKLISRIEQSNIPAPCPIEQRWTARSTAPMSPAYSSDADEIFTWVGIIMYIPPHCDEAAAQVIRQSFIQYVQCIQSLVEEYEGHCHWAKIIVPAESPAISKESWELLGGSKNKVLDFPCEDMNFWTKMFGTKPCNRDPINATNHLKEYIQKKYPVDVFNAYRTALDPKGILSNNMIDTLLSKDHILPFKDSVSMRTRY